MHTFADHPSALLKIRAHVDITTRLGAVNLGALAVHLKEVKFLTRAYEEPK